MALADAQEGRFEEAVAEAGRGIKLDDSPLMRAMAYGVLAIAGKRERASEVLAELNEVAKRRYVCPYEIGIVYLNLGDKDEAFRRLEKGFRDRSICMPLTKVDPRLDPIRSDPRYADLVSRLEFPR